MYFDLEDNRPDTPTMPPGMTRLERVLSTAVVYLLIVIAFLLAPQLPFIKEMEAQRQREIELEKQRELERQKEARRFVFVQPRVDMRAIQPPKRPELSDIDRSARTVERAPNPRNSLPFARGNSAERVEAQRPERGRAEPQPQPVPETAPPAPDSRALPLPEATIAANSASDPLRQTPERSSTGVIADAIRNVQKYAQTESFSNPQGGGIPEIAPSIQFDTKGVEFGPWLRRFVAQVRRNWFIPLAAQTMHGHVVITFNIHKDGRITDVAILKPSSIESFTLAARNAILTSNPTIPLPPEYPDDKAFFTVTFFYNERPYAP
jgi:TonB family protein